MAPQVFANMIEQYTDFLSASIMTNNNSKDMVNQSLASGLNESLMLQNLPMHDGITCSNCKERPLRGTRYKCLVCNAFNICQRCESI